MSCQSPTQTQKRSRIAIHGAKVQQKSHIHKCFCKKTIKYNKIGENLKKTHLFLNNRTYGGGNSLKTNTITKIQENKCNKTSHDRDRICIVFVVVSFGIRTDK